MRATFTGYRRSNGSVGIRNHVAVIPSVFCANTAAERIAAAVDGAVALRHPLGCGQVGFDLELTVRTLIAMGNHPNVAAVLVVGLGCERCKPNELYEGIKKSGKPVSMLVIQQDGGLTETIRKGVEIVKDYTHWAGTLKREAFPVSELMVATKCGGTDATSGLAANPVVGNMCDRLIADGGSAIISELNELIGTEDILARRAISEEVACKIREAVSEIEEEMRERCDLRYVTVVASAFFGAISGSAPATTAAIGSMMYNEMKEKGYNLDFSALLAAFAGTLGVIIPPSIGLVVIGTQTGTSVTKLFMVSAVAGVLLAVAYCFASKLSIAKSTSQMPVKKVSGKEVWDSFKDAIAGIVSPLIILGGIYSGMFTATESAVIAVVYSLIVGIFVYRELNPKVIVDCVIKSALTSSMVLILISVASLYSWLLTVGGTAMQIKNFVLSLNLTPLLFLVVASLIYLLLGMIIEGIPIIVLTAPILFPIAVALGIDPVLFGVITMLNIAYGNVTPPFGLCLFVASGFSKRNIIDMAKKGVFLYSIGMAMIILFCAFPGIIMWIIK